MIKNNKNKSKFIDVKETYIFVDVPTAFLTRQIKEKIIKNIKRKNESN